MARSVSKESSEMGVNLVGQVAVVTGGSRGIGFAVARALAGRGASVVITGLDQVRLDAARDRLVRDLADQAGRDAAEALVARDRVMAVTADVRDYAQVERVAQAVLERYGGLDVLVNNAGIGLFADVADQSLESWPAIIATNQTGAVHPCRATSPQRRPRGGGWIINISSLAGRNPFAGGAAYCASKAGLNAFSDALMQELRHDDIRVCLVAPGSVRTGFAGGSDGAGTEWKLAPEDVAQAIVELLGHPARSLPSRIEIRPSKPRKR
jgi:NAD(P)-dependent dehydrogenase (short-subunit alcohol dehydrogenase family)